MLSSASFLKTKVAEAVGIPMHKVVSRVRRLGGGFGGKIRKSPFYAAICAVAAKK